MILRRVPRVRNECTLARWFGAVSYRSLTLQTTSAPRCSRTSEPPEWRESVLRTLAVKASQVASTAHQAPSRRLRSCQPLPLAMDDGGAAAGVARPARRRRCDSPSIGGGTAQAGNGRATAHPRGRRGPEHSWHPHGARRGKQASTGWALPPVRTPEGYRFCPAC